MIACAAPPALILLNKLVIHALTGVAIEYRPFGPAILGNRRQELLEGLCGQRNCGKQNTDRSLCFGATTSG
jgi:hypothetical protein